MVYKAPWDELSEPENIFSALIYVRFWGKKMKRKVTALKDLKIQHKEESDITIIKAALLRTVQRLILRVILTGLRNTQVVGRILFLCVSMRVFPGEI